MVAMVFGLTLLGGPVCWGGAGEVAPVLESTRWNLEGGWRFRTDPGGVGEDEGWPRPEFDDSGWQMLRVPGYWEPQGVTDPRPGQAPKPRGRMPWTDYDGVGWYRLRFVVPEAWTDQELVLVLGSVDDEDRTFLNGTLIGATGPGIERSVLVPRRYRVPASAVVPGRESVLAVRVLDGGGPGGLMGPLVSLLPRKIAEERMELPGSDRSLSERFTDPPAGCRILKIVHQLPDASERQDLLLATLISQGFGGMVTNVSFDGYVESESKWDSFVSGVRKAHGAGMSLWLYDERGYPSGTAGGITLRDHPEWEAQGLFVSERRVGRGDAIELELPPGTLVSATAYPRTPAGVDVRHGRDLGERCAGGRLSWRPSPGEWHVFVATIGRLYENTHAAASLHDKLPYINLLMPEPTARFIEATHEQYASRLRDDLGRFFVATFTDEPSLMSRFFRPMPYRVLPWAPNLAGEFRRRRGYELRPVVPLLVVDGEGASKARYDFWLTVSELVSENFFGQIRTWCREHALASGGHLLLEEPLTDHVALYGDFMRCARLLDAPSIDCLTSIPAQVPWHVARLISSVAELNGSQVTMCETSDHVQRYRSEGDERPVRVVSEDEIRGTCNRLILGGITTITSYYSFAGLSSEQLRRVNTWVGRCCTMLTGGHQVTDIAVLYPVESVWPRFRPARNGPTDSTPALDVQGVYGSTTESLFAARRDFTFVDSPALCQAEAAGGALLHRDLRWRVLVLPMADTLPLAAWENVARFWRSGGVVVSLSALPANSEDEFPCPQVQDMAREIFGPGSGPRVKVNAAGGVGVFLPSGAEALLPVVLDGVLEADVSVAEPASPLRVTHRRIGGQEVYFLINDSDAACEATTSVAAEGQGEYWDPATGKVSAIGAGVDVPLRLGPFGAAVLRFPNRREPRRRLPQGGGLPGLSWTRLGSRSPEVGKGEHVRAEVEPLARPDRGDGPAWRARGVLTKGDVDTHLFLSFRYDAPAPLSGSHCLTLDTWVPAGQTTPSRLLVLLGEDDGSTYIADTSRPLGAAGHVHSFVPLSSFSLAGWSKDPDGGLDLTRITSVSIGWGGYYGREGEVVEFTLGLPGVGRLARAE